MRRHRERVEIEDERLWRLLELSSGSAAGVGRELDVLLDAGRPAPLLPRVRREEIFWRGIPRRRYSGHRSAPRPDIWLSPRTRWEVPTTSESTACDASRRKSIHFASELHQHGYVRLAFQNRQPVAAFPRRLHRRRRRVFGQRALVSDYGMNLPTCRACLPAAQTAVILSEMDVAPERGKSPTSLRHHSATLDSVLR